MTEDCDGRFPWPHHLLTSQLYQEAGLPVCSAHHRINAPLEVWPLEVFNFPRSRAFNAAFVLASIA